MLKMKKALPISHELLCSFKISLQIDESSPSGLTWITNIGKIKSGTFAGTLRSDGYWQVCFNRRIWQNHRIIWALVNNADPGQFQIDHIDGNPSNNTSKNLRLATVQQNQHNRQKIPCNNTSGFVGIDWRRDKCQWRARIKVNGKTINLGYFDSIDNAILVRKNAELKYFGNLSPLRT
jgi:hypothetical protein